MLVAKTNKELLDEINSLNKQVAGLSDQLRRNDEPVLSNKSTSETVDENSSFFRILIEEMNEGALIVDNKGMILYCYSYFAKIAGWPLERIRGQHFNDFIPGMPVENFKLMLNLSRKNVMKEEVAVLTATGETVPVLMSANTLPISEDLVFSIILTDLTTQHQNQDELRLRSRQVELKNLELETANKKLAFQNEEKEKRAKELTIANIELAYQNKEKENRSSELIIANKELAFQNDEKEKRAAELTLANLELAFQNKEKEDRADELTLANKELALQNDEKEKRAAELSAANHDLTAFTYVTSHDLQEPLRKIQTIVSMIVSEEENNLSQKSKDYFDRLKKTATRMRLLIGDLLRYSQAKSGERHFEMTDLNLILEEVIEDFDNVIQEKKAIIKASAIGNCRVIPFQFRQLFHNLIGNSLKFSLPEVPPYLIIKSQTVTHEVSACPDLLPEKKYVNLSIEDNGIGFDPQYKERIFEVFQRLHSLDEFSGTGIGLALCKRIVENHDGFITAAGVVNGGARIDIYLPV